MRVWIYAGGTLRGVSSPSGAWDAACSKASACRLEGPLPGGGAHVGRGVREDGETRTPGEVTEPKLGLGATSARIDAVHGMRVAVVGERSR